MTYPAIIVDENGDQTAGNTIDFTDPDNQPAPASAGLPPGWSADGSDLDAGGNALEGLSAITGTPTINAATMNAAGGSIGAVASDDGTTLGFYSATQVAQPAAPVTLGDVIAALKALGLVAT